MSVSILYCLVVVAMMDGEEAGPLPDNVCGEERRMTFFPDDDEEEQTTNSLQLVLAGFLSKTCVHIWYPSSTLVVLRLLCTPLVSMDL